MCKSFGILPIFFTLLPGLFSFCQIFTLFISLALFSSHLIASEIKDPTGPTTSETSFSSITDSGDMKSIVPTDKPLRLYQIIRSKKGHKALINGKFLHVNEQIEHYILIKIDAYEVTLLDQYNQKTEVISIFQQKPLPSTQPASNTTNNSANPPNPLNSHISETQPISSSSSENNNQMSPIGSALIPAEASILKELDINAINIDQMLKPLTRK